MNVSQIASLFRSYTDEPDATFLTDADVSTYLAQGYNQFRSFVSAIDPSIYTETADLVFNDTDSYQLAGGAVSLLGGTITAGKNRLVQIQSLINVTGSVQGIGVIYQAVTSINALDQALDAYFLEGTTLRLDRNLTGTLRITYTPEQSSTLWSNVAAATHVDDLVMFHDMIALYAYAQYAIRDNAQNAPLLSQLASREFALSDYLSRRVFTGPQYVSETLSSYMDN
jgi:hypothetical protein